MKKIFMIVTLCMMAMATCFAQDSATVQAKVNAIVKKFENTKGVECTTIGKGSGLGLVKMILSAESGSDFTKGVTKIIIIEYSEASQATCDALHQEFDGFKSILDDLSDADDKKEYSYFASYGKVNADDKSMSDFIIITEDKDAKMFMYMVGKIKVE